MKTLMLVLMLAMLTGCAGDYSDYAQTLQTHSTAESTRIAAQSRSISDMVATAKPSTPMEGTLLAVIGMMQVERLQFVPLPITKPTTGMDVFNTMAGNLPMAIMGLSNGAIVGSLAKVAGDRNQFNGTATLTDSMNKKYNTSINTGSTVSPSVVTTTGGDNSPIGGTPTSSTAAAGTAASGDSSAAQAAIDAQIGGNN